MMDLRELYQDIILDHGRHPRNFRAIEHPTHFASTEHMQFSLKNGERTASPFVSRTNIASAREEGWWGKPITVPQELKAQPVSK